MTQDMSFLSLPDRKLAYQQRIATPENQERPGVLFLGGFASDMMGTKAAYLDEKCAESGLGYTRFDYRGHGSSSARFEDGCIGDWWDDALAVLDRLTKGPQILVGSSMGGWIALLLARTRPERVAGFVGLAAAPDFTENLIRPSLNERQKTELARDGVTYEEGADPSFRVPITQHLMEDGRNHLILRAPLTLCAPVRLFQGMGDAEVPWRYALKILDALASDDVRVTFIKDADHRLKRPEDLDAIWREVRALVCVSCT